MEAYPRSSVRYFQAGGEEMQTRLQQFVTLLREFRTGMLTTQTNFGNLTTRPMTIQPPRQDKPLWLVAFKGCSSLENIQHSRQVNLSFSRESDKAWISISGKAEVNDDRNLIEKLWDSEWDIWVGPNTPKSDAVLIEIEPIQIDFWEPEHGKLGRLLELAKAHVTDHTPELAPVKTLHIGDSLLSSGLTGNNR